MRPGCARPGFGYGVADDDCAHRLRLALQSRQQDRFVERARLGLGVLPPLVGWFALLLPLVAASWIPLMVLIATYIGMVLVEHEGARRELVPPRYIWLRWASPLLLWR